MKKLALVALGVVCGSLAFGQELLTNPGFEANTFSTGTAPTGWTVIESGGISDYFSATTPVYDGAQSLALGAFGTPFEDDSFYQNIATTVGQQYTFSLWMYGDGTPGEVTMTFAGTVLYQTEPTIGSWTQQSFTVTATSTTSQVMIGGDNSPAYNYVDDASFQAVAAPEPASMAALGIGVLALIRRKRRS